jgi:hypothetical protein
MPESTGSGAYRIAERSGPGRRVVLRRESRDAADSFVIAEFRGPKWPAVMTAPAFAKTGGDSWRVECREGHFEFEARSVDRVVERPALFAKWHRPFALTAPNRVAVRVLLLLLRLPGGERLLSRWHARRNG